MKLSKLFDGIAEVESLGEIEVSSISSNSRSEITEGTLFVCIKGASFDGHSVAGEMLDKGACAVVTERDLGVEKQIIVNDSRAVYAELCAVWFGNPERELRLIGVTGTNGKTTITTVIKKILTELGHKTGLIGTCQNEIGEKILHTERTTPEPYDLFALLRQMADEDCEFAVMEVSSQGLEQKRLGKCFFEVAVFTNLTQDHLDVHGTMESYYQAKKLLFSSCGLAIVNIDDEYGKRCYNEISCPKFSFSAIGTSSADYFADEIKMNASGSEFKLLSKEKTLTASFAMAGGYNVSNAVAVLALCDKLGFDLERVVKILPKASLVRGRCESVPTGRDFSVILDYAHTPDAIENILASVKQYAEGRVVCLFGCGGNRDKTKRPLMAKAGAKYADFLVVTSDNPRNENPSEIIEDILQGLPKEFPHVTIENRREAIFWAVKNARRGDVLVLAGKGHEDYQILSTGKIHFDEREVVAQALEAL